MSKNFSVRKATEMAYYILEKCEVKKMNSYKLLKLMYLCERNQYISDKNFITNDSLYAMEKGGVLSNVYNLIKNKYNKSDVTIWSNVFKSEGNREKRTIELISQNFKVHDTLIN